MHKWISKPKEVGGKYEEVIEDVKTGYVVAVVSNLGDSYVQHIVDCHNRALSEAMKLGAEMCKETIEESNNAKC